MRRRRWLLAGSAAALTSAVVVAQDAPESLLPPVFQQPAPAPAPAPAPPASGGNRPPPPAAPAGSGEAGRPSTSGGTAQRPTDRAAPPAPVAPAGPRLGALDPELLEQLIALQRPRYDIPPGLSRSLDVVGVLDQSEGGMPADDTGVLNGAFVRSVIVGTRGPLVSRWGSILLRRALSSRLATPVGMNGADWAAIRADLLLRMGEAWPARALVQEVDSGDYTPALENAALGSFLATADILGLCPIAAISAVTRDEPEWLMAREICRSFEGEGTRAVAELERLRRRGSLNNIDALLAQKVAGAGLESRRAVRIEWNEVRDLTPWRLGLALATGLEPPASLLDRSGNRFTPIMARAPMLPLQTRAAAADFAAGRGVLSSAALVDLYAQVHASDDAAEAWGDRTAQLRRAYVAADPAARLTAMRQLWREDRTGDAGYGRRVLTAYAAARLPVSEAFADAGDELIASMLTAGLDRNAVRWGDVVPAGSLAWGMLAVAAPEQRSGVSGGALDAFHEDDASAGALRSRLLLAGLAGLRRVDPATAGAFSRTLGIDLNRRSRWTRAIDAAAASGNQTLVVLLAGAGMQGDSWGKMTALHLFHIVSALRRVGLEGEARMIAAEALARA